MNGQYIDLGDLDGTNGWVQTSGFVAWTEDVANDVPYQRIRLADDTTDDPVVCTVWDKDMTLEEGAGYRLTGYDGTYPEWNEVQFKIGETSEKEKFYPNASE